MDERCTAAAAGGGQLEALKWLRENGCLWDELTCKYAAGGGDIGYAHNDMPNDSGFPEQPLVYTSRHFEVLKWARDNGCPWDGHTMFSAAARGDIELMSWLREKGCPWGDDSFDEASRLLDNGYIGFSEVVQWMTENGCPS